VLFLVPKVPLYPVPGTMVPWYVYTGYLYYGTMVLYVYMYVCTYIHVHVCEASCTQINKMGQSMCVHMVLIFCLLGLLFIIFIITHTYLFILHIPMV
jgi:hypothetical protein